MKASLNAACTAAAWSAASPAVVRPPCRAASPIACNCSADRPSRAIAGPKALRSWVVSTAPSSAMPSTPPTSRLVFVTADPSPARCGPTAFMTAAVIGAIVDPMPWPIITKIGNSTMYGVVVVRTSPSSKSPPPARHRPYVIGARDPCLDA